MSAPPDTLHELLALALEDYDKISGTPGYIIDMSYWVRVTPNGCRVCLAGCVMVGRFGVDTDTNPQDCEDSEWANALGALDYLRQGQVGCAAREIGKPLPPMLATKAPKLADWYLGRVQWRADMTTLQAWLKERDL